MLPDDCPAHAALAEDLAEIKSKLQTVLDRLGGGDVTFATLTLRVQFLERLVYGAAGLALLGIGTAIMALVLKG